MTHIFGGREMSPGRVLLVDDDPKIRTVVRKSLEGEGFEIIEADTAECALGVFAGDDIDLVMLDINLGADNGFEVARNIRKTSQIPIIMISGKEEIIDKVVGLELGADDYITKPFHIREVLARVRAVLRRSQKANGSDVENPRSGARRSGSRVYHFDGLSLALDSLELFGRDGKEQELTSADFRLLGVFLKRPKRVLSREQLMDLTGGIDWTPLDRTIDNQVARLRKKIERDPSQPNLIKTVRGIGYMFVSEVDENTDHDLSKRA